MRGAIKDIVAAYAAEGTVLGAARVTGVAWGTAKKVLVAAGVLDPATLRPGGPRGHRYSDRRIEIVDAVAKHGSQSAAARVLGISHQCVSKVVAVERARLAQRDSAPKGGQS